MVVAGRFPEPKQPAPVAPHTIEEYSLTKSDQLQIQMESIVTLSDAKARFSEIVERATQGEEFVVTRMGRPVAKVVRYGTRVQPRKLGDLAGQIRISEDFDEWPPDLEEALGIKPH